LLITEQGKSKCSGQKEQLSNTEDNRKYITSVVMNNWQEVVLQAKDWREGYQLLTTRKEHVINITQCFEHGEIL
jgi:hypothetical protein